MSILLYLSCFAWLPPLIVIAAVKRKCQVNYFVELKLLIIIAAICDISSLVLAGEGMNNMPIVHLFTFAEFVLIALIYRKNFKKKSKDYLGAFLLIVAVYLLVNPIYPSNLFEFNSWARMIESLVLIILSMLWFIKIFQEMKIVKLSEHPMFYINSVVLLYIEGNFFIFTYYNLVVNQNQELMSNIWNIHSVLNIVFNILLAIAIWKMRVKYQPE